MPVTKPMTATYVTDTEFSEKSATAPLQIPEIVVEPAPNPSERPRTAQPAIPREKAYTLCTLIFFGDWLIACAAVFVGLQIRHWQRTGGTFDLRALDLRTSLLFWSLGGGTLFSWLMMTLKTYEVANLYRMPRWTKNLMQSVILWAVGVWAIVGLFQVTDFAPRLGVVYCSVVLVSFAVLWRLFSFALLIQPSIKESASSRVIVVGWNSKVAGLHKAMHRDLAQLTEIIGCVPMPGGHFATKPPVELAVLGDYSEIPRIVAECKVHSIILSDVSCSAREIEHLIKFCQREMVGFQMVPEYFPSLNSCLQVQTLSGVPLLGVSPLPLDRTLNRILKRTVDIIGSVVGLCVSAVVVPPFALLVCLESPGPFIQGERRISRGGRTFDMYRVRTTRADDADRAEGAPAGLTRIGGFMRRHDIDELPQFWNVLKGDMSIVGPYPEKPELIEQLKEEIPHLSTRHRARAGITGWAQIRGLQYDTLLRDRVEADIYYLENWSLTIDLYCILLSPFRSRKPRVTQS